MSSFLLLCAVIASLAVGVLVAQGLCALMFEVFRIRATQAATNRLAAAKATRLTTLQS